MSIDALCENCEFSYIDDETGELLCSALLDEDEMFDFISRGSIRCKYYRFYDEYKTVRKQM